MVTIKKFQAFAVWGDLYVSNKFYIAYTIIHFFAHYEFSLHSSLMENFLFLFSNMHKSDHTRQVYPILFHKILQHFSRIATTTNTSVSSQNSYILQDTRDISWYMTYQNIECQFHKQDRNGR
jgi:hypothetical protein